MPLETYWVHGNSVVIQFPGGAGLEFSLGHRMDKVGNRPWTDIIGLHEEHGTTFRGNGGNSNTFHFWISTPTYRDGRPRGKVESVAVSYDADDNVHITEVRLADGPTHLLSPPLPPNTNGNHSRLDTYIVLPIRPTMDMTWGLGISVTVQFRGTGNITFRAVGANFEI
jgi:hypothetical protein